MEAPAVTTSSPISSISGHHHRYSSATSTMTDDEDGVNSKLVIDLDGYSDGRGSYSPSEYYCYSFCDATSAATATQAERACGIATTASVETTTTTNGVSTGYGPAAKEASLSESIESVVSAAAAAAFASSPSTGGGDALLNGESEDRLTAAPRRPIIGNPGRSSNGSKAANGSRSRASPSISRPAQVSSDHDCSTKNTLTTGGAAGISTASSFRAGECSTSVRNRAGGGGGGESSRARQQTNRNAASKAVSENSRSSNDEVIATVLSSSPGRPSITRNDVASSGKSRRSANSSNKRSRTTDASHSAPNLDGNGSSSIADRRKSPIIGPQSSKDTEMSSNAGASSTLCDGQRNEEQNGSSIIAQIEHLDLKTSASVIRPPALLSAKETASPASDGLASEAQQEENSSDSSTDAGLKMKIKRKKMATRHTAASHEIISDQQCKKQHSDEASTSSSSSSCASPAPTTVANGNLSLPSGGGTGKKRKSSSSSISDLRPFVNNASSSSPATTSLFGRQNQPQRHFISNASTPLSGGVNRANSFNSGVPVVASRSTECSLSSMANEGDARDGGSLANVASETSKVEVNSHGKQATTTTKGDSISSGTPPRKKSKINSQSGNVKSEGNQSQQNLKQDVKPKISGLVFRPLADMKPREAEQQDIGTWVRTVGTSTETECLGPCEPGTSVTLEGIVWQETAGGILVINVTWRGKTYVGTLLDCTKYDWAPPRHCDSPHSENDIANGTSASVSAGGHRTPSKSGNGGGSGNGNNRGRKGGGNRELKRQQQFQLQQQQQQQQTADATASSSSCTEQEATNNATEASNNASTGQNGCNGSGVTKPATVSEPILEPHSPIMYECPLGGCEKKFAAVVGVKYHQSSAHPRQIESASSKEKRRPCQHGRKLADPSAKECVVSTAFFDENGHAGLEEAEATSTKLSPEERASLDSLFKVTEKPKLQGQQQEFEKSSVRADSPAYSDISEDETAPPSLTEHPPAVSTASAVHSNHPTEKPTAIVEPQPLASTTTTTTGHSAETAPSLTQQVTSMEIVRLSDPSALQPTPRGQKRNHAGAAKSPKESKQEKTPSEIEKTRLAPHSAFPSTSRSPEAHKPGKSHVMIKPEPGSPRQSSSTSSVQEFTVPTLPAPYQRQSPSVGVQLPPRQTVQPHSSAAVVPRTPTPSQLPLPSPGAGIIQSGPTPLQASPAPAPPSHLNMLSQLNHPAFMFNPFSANGPMFPSGSMAPGVLPPTMGIDPTMAAAAALMAAGHPAAAAMYAPAGGMAAAALAAAGFQMGLGNAQPSPHSSVGFAFGPPQPSLASSMAPGILPPSFVGPAAAQLLPQPTSSPGPALQLQQQSLHKIHELAEHAKRATPTGPVANSLSLPQNSSATTNGEIVQKSASSSSPINASASSINVGTAGKHRSAGTASKLSSNTTSTSLGIVQSHAAGPEHTKASDKAVAPHGIDSGGQQKLQQQLTPGPTSLASDLKRSTTSVSPPVQRHLHTHHHTHTYPTLLGPGIDPSYAAMVASQQAAAAAAGVVGNFPSFGTPQKP